MADEAVVEGYYQHRNKAFTQVVMVASLLERTLCLNSPSARFDEDDESNEDDVQSEPSQHMKRISACERTIADRLSKNITGLTPPRRGDKSKKQLKMGKQFLERLWMNKKSIFHAVFGPLEKSVYTSSDVAENNQLSDVGSFHVPILAELYQLVPDNLSTTKRMEWLFCTYCKMRETSPLSIAVVAPCVALFLKEDLAGDFVTATIGEYLGAEDPQCPFFSLFDLVMEFSEPNKILWHHLKETEIVGKACMNNIKMTATNFVLMQNYSTLYGDESENEDEIVGARDNPGVVDERYPYPFNLPKAWTLLRLPKKSSSEESYNSFEFQTETEYSGSSGSTDFSASTHSEKKNQKKTSNVQGKKKSKSSKEPHSSQPSESNSKKKKSSKGSVSEERLSDINKLNITPKSRVRPFTMMPNLPQLFSQHFDVGCAPRVLVNSARQTHTQFKREFDDRFPKKCKKTQEKREEKKRREEQRHVEKKMNMIKFWEEQSLQRPPSHIGFSDQMRHPEMLPYEECDLSEDKRSPRRIYNESGGYTTGQAGEYDNLVSSTKDNSDNFIRFPPQDFSRQRRNSFQHRECSSFGLEHVADSEIDIENFGRDERNRLERTRREAVAKKSSFIGDTSLSADDESLDKHMKNYEALKYKNLPMMHSKDRELNDFSRNNCREMKGANRLYMNPNEMPTLERQVRLRAEHSNDDISAEKLVKILAGDREKMAQVMAMLTEDGSQIGEKKCSSFNNSNLDETGMGTNRVSLISDKVCNIVSHSNKSIFSTSACQIMANTPSRTQVFTPCVLSPSPIPQNAPVYIGKPIPPERLMNFFTSPMQATTSVEQSVFGNVNTGNPMMSNAFSHISSGSPIVKNIFHQSKSNSPKFAGSRMLNVLPPDAGVFCSAKGSSQNLITSEEEEFWATVKAKPNSKRIVRLKFPTGYFDFSEGWLTNRKIEFFDAKLKNVARYPVTLNMPPTISIQTFMQVLSGACCKGIRNLTFETLPKFADACVELGYQCALTECDLMKSIYVPNGLRQVVKILEVWYCKAYNTNRFEKLMRISGTQPGPAHERPALTISRAEKHAFRASLQLFRVEANNPDPEKKSLIQELLDLSVCEYDNVPFAALLAQLIVDLSYYVVELDKSDN